jgi:hypothetical protein
MAATIPRELFIHIMQFLPWMVQIEVLPELKKSLLPELEERSTRIKIAMKSSKQRILADINQEQPHVDTMRAALCLYQSDDFRMSNLKKVINHPKYFSLGPRNEISLGNRLNWPSRKTHRRMIMKMSDSDLETCGW